MDVGLVALAVPFVVGLVLLVVWAAWSANDAMKQRAALRSEPPSPEVQAFMKANPRMQYVGMSHGKAMVSMPVGVEVVYPYDFDDNWKQIKE